MSGKVFLVGAGPGDEGLLTVKGRRILESAEVVVYDRLVGEDILALMPGAAEKINVGKNSGHHPVPQEEINKILLEKAREGKRVVRLKGGDCFLFGRGGEELELLRENGVEFEVVPGIPSPVAATAYAGIPITHRDFCSSVHFITGHRKKDGVLGIDYKSLVRSNGTLVFLMSVASCGEIADGLISAGMPESMDAAVIENGTRPEQRRFVTTLGNIEKTVKCEKIVSPALIVVGRVCSLADRLDWFDALALHGKRVLVTSPKGSASRLAERLKNAGASVKTLPLIKTEELPFDLPDGREFKAAVFTSAVGVRAFWRGLEERGLDARWFGGMKVCAVGSECAAALEQIGIRADIVPSVFNGGALGREMLEKEIVQKGERVLLLRAEKASRALVQVLNDGGVETCEVPVYKTVALPADDTDPADFDWVTFTSAGCVESFAKSFDGRTDFTKIRALCIGPVTAEGAEKLGMTVYMPERATIDSMVDYLIEVNK